MSKRDKYSRSTRKVREQNNKILVVCGGQTEKMYLEKFNIDLGEIKIVPILERKSPTQIVQFAIDMRLKNKYISTWCVFDKDDFTDFDFAIALGEKYGIKVAYSNQAVELWIILHFKVRNGQLHRTKYKQIIEKLLDREYDKTDEKLYKILKVKTATAIQNAKIGHQTHKKNGGQPSQWESCTTFYKLVEELNRWKK